MKVVLQCKGPKDDDWKTLNTMFFPVGPTWFDIDERKKADKRINQLHQGWAMYFVDHQFRVVKPRGF